MTPREADALRALLKLGKPMPHYEEIADVVWGERTYHARQKVQRALAGLERKGYIKTIIHEVTREIIVL